MPDQRLDWNDPTDGAADLIQVLYTDTAGATPDTLLTSVGMGVETYTVLEANAPTGRRFAVRGVNTTPNPDLNGPVSNIVEVGGITVTSRASWAYHAKDWNGATNTLPSAVSGGPDASGTNISTATDADGTYLAFDGDSWLQIVNSTATQAGSGDVTWVYVFKVPDLLATDCLGSDRYGAAASADGSGWEIRVQLNNGAILATVVVEGVGSAQTGGPASAANTLNVLRLVRDSTANTLTAYINGTAGTAETAPAGDLSGLRDTYIGIRGTGAMGSNDFVGNIYAVGMWKEALTDTEADTFATESQA